MNLNLLCYAQQSCEGNFALIFNVNDPARNAERQAIEHMTMRVLNDTAGCNGFVASIEQITLPFHGLKTIERAQMSNEETTESKDMLFVDSRVKLYQSDEFPELLFDFNSHPERYRWITQIENRYDSNPSVYENVDLPDFGNGGESTHILIMDYGEDGDYFIVGKDNPHNRELITKQYYEELEELFINKENWTGEFKDNDGLEDEDTINHFVYRIPLSKWITFHCLPRRREVEILEHVSWDIKEVDGLGQWKNPARAQRYLNLDL